MLSDRFCPTGVVIEENFTGVGKHESGNRHHADYFFTGLFDGKRRSIENAIIKIPGAGLRNSAVTSMIICSSDNTGYETTQNGCADSSQQACNGMNSGQIRKKWSAAGYSGEVVRVQKIDQCGRERYQEQNHDKIDQKECSSYPAGYGCAADGHQT